MGATLFRLYEYIARATTRLTLDRKITRSKVHLGEKLNSMNIGDAAILAQIKILDQGSMQTEGTNRINPWDFKSRHARKKLLEELCNRSINLLPEDDGAVAGLTEAKKAIEEHDQFVVRRLTSQRKIDKPRACFGAIIIYLIFLGTTSRNGGQETSSVEQHGGGAVASMALVPDENRLSNANPNERQFPENRGDSNHNALSQSNEVPTRSELIDLAYRTAASVALSKPLGSGPSPEEFIQSTRAAARVLGAEKYAHTKFLLTLDPSDTKEQTIEGAKVKMLYYGSEQALFVNRKDGSGYTFIMCTIDGKKMMNTDSSN